MQNGGLPTGEVNKLDSSTVYMLKVKTKVDRSPIHGIGLFADEDIPKGTIIWEWTTGVDSVVKKEIVNGLDEVGREYFKTYAWINDGGDYCLCGDNDRFANHSEIPTCDSTFVSGEWVDTAMKNIKRGEEITYNYWQFHKGEEL